MSNINVSFGLPKWQVAVLLSAPLAFGIGYMYFRTSDKRSERPPSIAKSLSIDSDEKDKKRAEERAADANAEPIAKPQSILERAIEKKNDGNRSFRAAKYNDAIKSYDEAIALCPHQNKLELSTFYQNRAAAYEQLKKWTKVKEDCTSALALNPNYAKALSRRAKAYESLDELRSALEDITGSCIIEGFRNEVSLTYADRVLKKLGEYLWDKLLRPNSADQC